MQIRKLEVRNFCQHTSRDIEFTDGLTAILGPNGSGKSNLLGAVRFALTGENPNNGAKNDNICERSDPSEVSYVSLSFMHAGVSATVRRNLRPAKPVAVLTVDTTGEVIEGDTAVNARIETILGVDRATVNDIIIVAQNDIFGALDKTPAVRAAQFQRLFHTEDAELIYQLVGDQLKNLRIPTIVGNPDEIRFNLDNAVNRLQQVEQHLQGIPPFEDLQQRRDNHVRCLNDAARFSQTQIKLQQHRELLKQVTHQENQSQQEISQVSRDLETVKQAAAGKQTAVTDAKVALQSLYRYQKEKGFRDTLTTQIADCQKKLNELVQPEQPPGYEPSHLYSQRITTTQYEKEALSRFVASFNGDVAECPTCGTSTATLRDKLTAAEGQLRTITLELEKLTIAHSAAFTYEQAKQRYESTRDQLQLQLTQSQRHFEQLPKLDAANVDEVALQKLITDYKVYEEGIAEYQQILNSKSMLLGSLQGQISTLTNQISQLEQEFGAMTCYAEADIVAANNAISHIDQYMSQRRSAETTAATTQTEINHYRQQLSHIEQSKQQVVMFEAWQGYCQELRSLFHKDGAPKFVAQRNLQRLQFSVNETLEMFETDFRVAADENLSFRATFSSGVTQPADRLSQGQRVILALAFRLALNLLLAENIGALYLDEPTAWLDEHHIRGFEPVLTRLREFSASRGLQVIIITHEHQLAPLFDSVVRL